MVDDSKRDEFLNAMYAQMWGNIGRHITLSWQPLVLVGFVAAMVKVALDGQISIGFAAAGGYIVTAWFMGQLYDANGWYHRNHLIIANLERHFSKPGDEFRINPFMGMLIKPERMAKMLTTFRVHQFLAMSLAFGLLFLHVYLEIWPACSMNEYPRIGSSTSPLLLLPPVVALGVSFLWAWKVRTERIKQYEGAFQAAEKARN